MLKELYLKYKRFIRFAIVGTVAWLILYGVYYLLLGSLGHSAAYTIGYIVSFIVNYLLTVKFTFEVKASAGNGIGFMICHAINWLLQLLLLNLFISLGMSDKLAPIPVLAVSVPVNFLMVRFVMNRFPGDGDREGGRKRYYAAGLIALATLYVFAMNLIVPFFGDDYAFSYLSDGRKIASLGDALRQTAYFYQVWNGRLIPNFLGFSFVPLVGDAVFNVLNTMVFLLSLVLMVLYLRRKPGTMSPVAITALVAGLLLINSDDLFYWAAGACNYLWPLPLFLGLLMLSERCLEGEMKQPWWLLMILGFFMSLTHEVYIMPLCGTLGIILLARLIRRKWDWKLFFLTLGIGLALCVVMLNPGFFKKLGAAGATTGSLLMYMGRVFVKVVLDLRLFYLVLVGLLILRIRDRDACRQFVRDNSFLLILSFMGLVPAIAASTGDRALICTELSSLFVLTGLIGRFLTDRKWNYVAAAAGVLILCFMAVTGWHSYFNWNKYRDSEKAYFGQEGGTVLLDDSHNYAAYLLPGYVMNLNKLYDACVKGRLIEEKCYLLGIEECEPIAPLPQSVQSLLLQGDGFFSEANRIPGSAGWYSTDKCHFYIAPYDEWMVEKINEGCLSFRSVLPLLKSRRLYVNISAGEILGETMPVRVVDAGSLGNYILFPKDYKSYPLVKVEEINLLDEAAAARFEIR